MRTYEEVMEEATDLMHYEIIEVLYPYIIVTGSRYIVNLRYMRSEADGLINDGLIHKSKYFGCYLSKKGIKYYDPIHAFKTL